MSTQTEIQINRAKLKEDEQRKKLTLHLRLRSEGWPKMIIERRSKLSLTRAKKLAKIFGVEFKLTQK